MRAERFHPLRPPPRSPARLTRAATHSSAKPSSASWVLPLRACASRVGGTATGTRVSTVCGNAVVDPGEDCDVGPAGGSCCTFGCPRVAADAGPAPLDDYGCGPGVTPCATCAVGSCDGHGACIAVLDPLASSVAPGHTVCDLDEACDGSSLACPPDQMVPPPDTDGDGLNDGCDPCTDGGQVSKSRAHAEAANAGLSRTTA